MNQMETMLFRHGSSSWIQAILKVPSFLSENYYIILERKVVIIFQLYSDKYKKKIWVHGLWIGGSSLHVIIKSSCFEQPFLFSLYMKKKLCWFFHFFLQFIYYYESEFHWKWIVIWGKIQYGFSVKPETFTISMRRTNDPRDRIYSNNEIILCNIRDYFLLPKIDLNPRKKNCSFSSVDSICISRQKYNYSSAPYGNEIEIV